MAQQTRRGYVYVISNIGSFGRDIYKIGMTRRLDPIDRIRELSNASVPFPYDVRKHSKKCTFYTLRFGCSFAAVNTIKPQLL